VRRLQLLQPQFITLFYPLPLPRLLLIPSKAHMINLLSHPSTSLNSPFRDGAEGSVRLEFLSSHVGGDPLPRASLSGAAEEVGVFRKLFSWIFPLFFFEHSFF